MAAQQPVRLARAEGQFGAADLADPGLRAVAVQRECGIDPAEEDEAQLRSGVGEDEVQVRGNVPGGRVFESVEYEDDRAGQFGQRGGEAHDERVVDVVGAGRAADAVGQRHPVVAEGAEDIGPEHTGCVVVVLQGEPHHGAGRQVLGLP